MSMYVVIDDEVSLDWNSEYLPRRGDQIEYKSRNHAPEVWSNKNERITGVVDRVVFEYEINYRDTGHASTLSEVFVYLKDVVRAPL